MALFNWVTKLSKLITEQTRRVGQDVGCQVLCQASWAESQLSKQLTNSHVMQKHGSWCCPHVIEKNFQPLHLCCLSSLVLFWPCSVHLTTYINIFVRMICLYFISVYIISESVQVSSRASLLSLTESWGLWTHVASHAACNIILIRHKRLNSHLSLCYYCKQANNTNKLREIQHKELGLPTSPHVDEAMKQEAKKIKNNISRYPFDLHCIIHPQYFSSLQPSPF